MLRQPQACELRSTACRFWTAAQAIRNTPCRVQAWLLTGCNSAIAARLQWLQADHTLGPSNELLPALDSLLHEPDAARTCSFLCCASCCTSAVMLLCAGACSMNSIGCSYKKSRCKVLNGITIGRGCGQDSLHGMRAPLDDAVSGYTPPCEAALTGSNSLGTSCWS